MRASRLVIVTVLILALGGPQVSALPRPEVASREVKSTSRNIVALLSRLGSLLISLRSKEGSMIDPLGGSAASPSNTEAGCTINPLGLCTASTPSTEAGCTINPWGGCGSD